MSMTYKCWSVASSSVGVQTRTHTPIGSVSLNPDHFFWNRVSCWVWWETDLRGSATCESPLQ